jgi:hypothetical protein
MAISAIAEERPPLLGERVAAEQDQRYFSAITAQQAPAAARQSVRRGTPQTALKIAQLSKGGTVIQSSSKSRSARSGCC